MVMNGSRSADSVVAKLARDEFVVNNRLFRTCCGSCEDTVRDDLAPQGQGSQARCAGLVLEGWRVTRRVGRRGRK